MIIKNKHDDAEIYQALLVGGDNYLPDVIIDNNFSVDGYSDITIDKVGDDFIEGTCLIECQDEETDDYSYNANYNICIDEDGEVESIEFTNVILVGDEY